MTKFPWKTTLAASAILAATVYAYAQMSSGGPMGMHGQMQGGMNGGTNSGMNGSMAEMHRQMMQGQGPAGMQGNMGQGMHDGMHQGMQGGMGGHGMHGQQSGALGAPTMPGQDAFGTIQEIVQILQADPSTDWSKVNIAALRQHLIDMNEVTLRAAAAERVLDNGIEVTVTGEGRTMEAIKRMVPAHVRAARDRVGGKERRVAERRQTHGDGERDAPADHAQGSRLHGHHGAGRPPPAASSDDGEGRIPDALALDPEKWWITR
jgi:hypothetical protein